MPPALRPSIPRPMAGQAAAHFGVSASSALALRDGKSQGGDRLSRRTI